MIPFKPIWGHSKLFEVIRGYARPFVAIWGPRKTLNGQNLIFFFLFLYALLFFKFNSFYEFWLKLRFVVLPFQFENFYSCLCERPKGEEIGIFQSLLFYFEKWCCVKCGLVNHLPVKDLWKAIRVFEVIHLFGEITAFETIWIISCLAAIYPHANYPIYQNPRTQTILYTNTKK